MKTYIHLSINERINYKGNLTGHWNYYGQSFKGLTGLYTMAYDFLIHPNSFRLLNRYYYGHKSRPKVS